MTTTSPDQYARRPVSLVFHDPRVEARYRHGVLDRALLLCRGAWFLVPVLSGAFGVMDHAVFGATAPVVMSVRVAVMVVGLAVFAASFWHRLRPWFVGSSAAFIILVGSFCVFLVAMDDRTTMSPYVAGLFLTFAAVHTTAGVGFRSSLIAQMAVSLLFLVTVSALAPVDHDVVLLYAIFTGTALVVFGYSAWIVERVSRESFATAEQLRQTLDEVRTLSGLLPICASCKNVRDDRGYWNQIEAFISERSDATFSHSICPSCAKELYPDYDLDEETPADEGDAGTVTRS